MKILYAASEAVPFCKTGGLADVAGSLPAALAAQGADVAVVLPLYQKVKEKFSDQLHFECYDYVDLAWRHSYCGLFSMERDGVTWSSWTTSSISGVRSCTATWTTASGSDFSPGPCCGCRPT